MTSPTRPAAITCDHGLRRQTIVETLLEDVIRGRVAPGQHLVTQTLAHRFGVSHTPVREALIALSGMGVLDVLPNRGAIVRRFTETEVREICQVRRALECEAVRSACGRIDPDELTRLRKELEAMVGVRSADRPRFVLRARELDSRLHDLIAGSCGNAFLAQELERLTLLFRAFRDAGWARDQSRNDYRRLELEAHEHLAIVDALLIGNRIGAVRAMSQHIRSGVRYWSRALPQSSPLSQSNHPRSARLSSD
ncbi:GntR family transcriptional regulator [Tautonia rosea]|uniref:GntR family transcriptional regulator n=1 Tax=Tautonia rosea TaxID=2728037 RepID=UPI0028F43550|nr:GntR family transcriptional regulator [Tautonia rosea]